jgi:hypothetical protein
MFFFGGFELAVGNSSVTGAISIGQSQFELLQINVLHNRFIISV